MIFVQKSMTNYFFWTHIAMKLSDTHTLENSQILMETIPPVNYNELYR
jgi:hypothetical protein